MFRKDKKYFYQRRPIVFVGMEGNMYHFQLPGGAKVLIDFNRTDLIKETLYTR